MKHWVHIAAIFALCSRFLVASTPGLLTADEYSLYVREGLSRAVMDSPNTAVVQALLTMAMKEWGDGNAYCAWMYSGKMLRLQIRC